MTVKFDVHYHNDKGWSHKYTEEWEKTEFFCPACGKRPVWHETGMGDYYVGEEFLCLVCEVRFYLPMGVEVRKDDPQDIQRLGHLRKEQGK